MLLLFIHFYLLYGIPLCKCIPMCFSHLLLVNAEMVSVVAVLQWTFL